MTLTTNDDLNNADNISPVIVIVDIISPGQFIAFPLCLNKNQDLRAVPDLLKQPSQLGLLLVLLADVHNLG